MTDEATLQAEVTRLEEQLGEIYRELWPIREQLADLRGKYELPPARNQTDRQRLVASCPRCGGKISVNALPKEVQ